MKRAVGFDIDTSEFETALDEMDAELQPAGAHAVTKAARQYLSAAVRNMPLRTGNLRSGATTPWRRLGMGGRPLTMLKEGYKRAEYEEKGKDGKVRLRSGEFYSRGSYVDDRNNPFLPSFEYAIYAAEKRNPKYGDSNTKLLKALAEGIFSPSDIGRIYKLVNQAGFVSAWALAQELLAGSPRGRTLLMGQGYWKPYHFVFKGNRKLLTAAGKEVNWDWNDFQKVFRKHKGKSK